MKEGMGAGFVMVEQEVHLHKALRRVRVMR